MSRPIPTHASLPHSNVNGTGNASASRASHSSSFIERHFGRRPKTAQPPLQPSPSSPSLVNPSDPHSHSARSRSGFDRTGLPRSSSSSRVQIESPQRSAQIGFPFRDESSNITTTTTSPAASRLRPSTASDATSLGLFPSTENRLDLHQHRSSSNSQMTSGNGGGAFGRMFRRYSQGAGRNDTGAPQSPSSSTLSPQVNSSVRGTNTPPRSTSYQSSPGLPRSSSTNTPGLPSYDSVGIANSQTLAVLADENRVSPATRNSSPSQNAAPEASAIPDVSPAANVPSPANGTSATAAAPSTSQPTSRQTPVHRIRLVPHLEATRSLHFEPIERDLKEGAATVKVGRFTDRQPVATDPTIGGTMGANGQETGGASADMGYSTIGQPGARGGAIPVSGGQGGSGRIDSSRVAFKSKVVSRGHAEVWCEPGGSFFIRDTKSSSGTFLNHIRLSAPNVESRAFVIKDGDVIQLGVDYQGGTEEIYRCVKMRVELNRGWQREANQFNVNALRQLRALQGTSLHPAGSKEKEAEGLPTNRQSVSVTDCCICLFSVTVCQALFIAPCSHVFHYKCIRPMLTLHHPGFSCPLCRTFADLEADVEENEAWQAALLKEATADESRAALDVSTPRGDVEASLDSVVAATTTQSPVAPAGHAEIQVAAVASALRAASLARGEGSPSRMGRGTAPSAQRRAEWARPDTAVGSSAGPMFEANGEADQIEDVHLVGAQPISQAEAEEMAVVDRILDEGVRRTPHCLSEPSSESSFSSPLRRGSGPIEISGRSGRQAKSPSSAENSTGSPPARYGNASTPNSHIATSPGSDEARTPMNHTFLSTLAEAPVANGQARDFFEGRSAPAAHQVPTTPAERSLDHAGASGGRLSEGGDETKTAENAPVPSHASALAQGLGSAAVFITGGRDKLKEKERSRGSSSMDLKRDSSPETDEDDTLSKHRSSRSRSGNRSGAVRASSQASPQFETDDGPVSPVYRAGTNLNASAYLRLQSSHSVHETPNGGGSNGNSRHASPSVVDRGTTSTASSAMAKFKRKISGAM